MEQPNVLLIIWDACRLDVARNHAPNLRRLAEDNLWFENAITPAGQSLGSHVSMLTGEYPHEHGIYRQTDFIDSPLPLLEELGERGYKRYAVSANGFASPRYGFDRGFDAFYNTQGVTAYPEGLDLHRQARRIREENGGVLSVDTSDRLRILREAITHQRPIKSLLNVAVAGLSELSAAHPSLQRLPHPRFNRYNEFCYDPNRNTRIITSLLEEAKRDSGPFFLLTNYMDPHHPYAPPERFQREYCGRTFSYRELSELGEMTHPWNYLERLTNEGNLDTETLETVRGLYRGEVRCADEHLGRLLEDLERTGLREETLVIVVADHGENLGEENGMGERHMGHVRSAGDHHLRVPLVVAHPELRGRAVEQYVSIKNLYGLLTAGMDRLIESDGQEIDPLLPRAGVASAEIPPTTTTELVEKYQELKEILERHLSASYAEGWKVVVSSTGTEHAWERGEERPIESAPSHVREASREHLRALVGRNDDRRDLSKAERSHLEALGYL